MHLIPLGSRHPSYDVLADTRITVEGATALASAAEQAWSAALAKDAARFGEAFRLSFEAQIAMYPNMVDEEILTLASKHLDSAFGYKLSGAGGGGYFILFQETPVDGAVQVKIRRKEV